MICRDCKYWGAMVPTETERVQAAFRNRRSLGVPPIPIYVSNLQTYMGCRNPNCGHYRKPRRVDDCCLAWTRKVSR